MLNNVLIITDPSNYDSFEEFVKKSWGKFFGSICTSVRSAFSWMTSNSCNFDLIVTVVKKDQIEKFGKEAAVIKRIADRYGLKIVVVDQEEIEQDDLKKVIEENLVAV